MYGKDLQFNPLLFMYAHSCLMCTWPLEPLLGTTIDHNMHVKHLVKIPVWSFTHPLYPVYRRMSWYLLYACQDIWSYKRQYWRNSTIQSSNNRGNCYHGKNIKMVWCKEAKGVPLMHEWMNLNIRIYLLESEILPSFSFYVVKNFLERLGKVNVFRDIIPL